LLGNASNIHERNNKTTVLCNPFLGNGSVNTRTAIELVLEALFLVRSVQSNYKEDNWYDPVSEGLAAHFCSAREDDKRWRYSSVAGYSPNRKELSARNREICTVNIRYQETTVETLRAGEDLVFAAAISL
jgi:hypothetical protein